MIVLAVTIGIITYLTVGSIIAFIVNCITDSTPNDAEYTAFVNATVLCWPIVLVLALLMLTILFVIYAIKTIFFAISFPFVLLTKYLTARYRS